MIKAGNKGNLVEKRITGTGTAGLFVGILGVAIEMGIRKKKEKKAAA